MMRAAGWTLALALALRASDASAQLPLRFDRLAVEDGLSGANVEAVARDATGFLWAGGQHGLDRYDGVRVQAFGPNTGARGLPAPHVRALASDPAVPGGMWVGTDTGPARYDPRTERFTAFRATTGDAEALGSAVRALLPDADGVWLGTTGAGLVRLEPARGRSRGWFAVYRPGATADTIRALLAPLATPGVLWVGTTGGLARLETQRRSFVTGHAPVTGPVTALAEADGAVWCATADGTLHRLDPATDRLLRSWRIGAQVSDLAASAAFPSRLWVATRGRGLLALDTRTGALSFADGGAVASHVLAVTEAPSGLLWAGATSALYRADLRGARFTTGAPHPLGSPEVLALYEAPTRPGVVWAGTLRGEVYRLDRRTSTLRPFVTRPGGLPDPVFAFHEDARGGLWLGGVSRGGSALFRLDRASGAVERHAVSAVRDVIYGLYEAPSRPDVMWVATDGLGLIAFDTRRRAVWRRFRTAAPGELRDTPVWALVEAPDEPGVLWVATQGAGLLRLDLAAGAIAPAPRRPGCNPGDSLYALAPTPGGGLWIGAARYGLLLYNRRTGQCQRHPPDDGRPTDARAVFLDGHRRVWMSTRTGGLVRYDVAQRTFTRFTTADGLPDDEFYISARLRVAAGDLLLGGPGGLVAFDPERVSVDTTAPPVVLTRLLVDGAPYPLVREGDGFQPISLPYNRHDLAFEFAALDLRAPGKNRYRIRLDGVGTRNAWQGLGSQAAARFPFLSPGRYTFRVEGANSDGYWSRTPAMLAFTIRPPFWRAWYFWTAAASLVVGLIVAAYQYRIGQMRRLERTRQRIADDLHDDIGSKLGSIALHLGLAAESTAPLEPRQLDRLAHASGEVVSSLRDAVWFVDANHDDLEALVARMEQFAEEMLRGRRHAFFRPATLVPAPLAMEVRHELYLFFKEALHNAVKHGGDGPVEVRVAFEDRLHLSVADSGPGFDPDQIKWGRGLKTMRRRAAALGGAFWFESAPGCGTTVHLLVALSRKYTTFWGALRSILHDAPPSRRLD